VEIRARRNRLMHMTRQQFDAITELIHGERLPGRPDQGIYGVSAIQNFKIGARRQMKDSWVFHYCKATAALTATENHYRLAGCQKSMLLADELTLAVGALAGQKLITIPDTTSPVNYYQGGTIECWGTAYAFFELHRIASSTASNGTSVVLTLEEPLLNTLIIGHGVVPMPSVYAAVGPMGVTYARREYAVCLPMVPVSLNNYFWGLTWGPCFMGMQASGWPEDADDCMDVFAWQDGTVAHLKAWPANTDVGANTSPQRVGTGLYRGNYGASRIMLKLDP
jgi:hypothetical protein